MNAEPMLPCPFCGSAPFPLEYPEGGETGEVRCLKLDCPIDDVFIPIEQWNRPRVKDPVISEPVAVFEIDKSGYRARIVLDPAKPFPSSGTKLYAEQPAPVAVVIPERDDLQQRLTVAEQRAGDLEGLLRDINDAPGGSQFKKHIDAALKPAERGDGS